MDLSRKLVLRVKLRNKDLARPVQSGRNRNYHTNMYLTEHKKFDTSRLEVLGSCELAREIRMSRMSQSRVAQPQV
jgi:hypothetical protein